MRRDEPTGYGLEMLAEFARVVVEAEPEWWLLENVARVPSVTELPGHSFAHLGHSYIIQRLDINLAWFCDSTRLRHIQFGSKSGRLLNVTRRVVTGDLPGAALASDDRPFRELCQLQGLPESFDIPPFLMSEKKKAVGNGVPLPMGRALAQAVIDAYTSPVVLQRDLAGQVTPARICACGCGRQVTGRPGIMTFPAGKGLSESVTPPGAVTGCDCPAGHTCDPSMGHSQRCDSSVAESQA